MQQYFSATSQGKSNFISKFLHLQNNNNNKKISAGGKSNPKARNFCFCKDSVGGGAIPFEIIPP